MTRKLTFREWEKAMAQKILDVQEATQTICGVIMGTPLRQTAKEKIVAIDGLNALERRLRGELDRARRKHIKRQKTMCQCCGENRAEWRTAQGLYLCADCACSRHTVLTRVPRCEYCGGRIGAVRAGWLDSDTGLYCSKECALRANGCEPMTEKEEENEDV